MECPHVFINWNMSLLAYRGTLLPSLNILMVKVNVVVVVVGVVNDSLSVPSRVNFLYSNIYAVWVYQRPHPFEYTVFYSTGCLTILRSKFKKIVKNPILIGINSNFLHNIRLCICIRKCNKKGEISLCHF